MLDKLHKHNFQISLAYWIIQYDDPMNILDRFKYKTHSKNYPLWENTTYINLLNQINQTNDLKLRNELMEKAEETLIEEMPLAPIYHMNYIILSQPNVKRFHVGPVGDIHFDLMYKEEK